MLLVVNPFCYFEQHKFLQMILNLCILFSLQIKGSVKSYSVLDLEEMCQSQGVERETQYRPGEVNDETYIS